MDLEIEWVGIYWIDLAQDKDQWRALVNTVNDPTDSIKCLKALV
jgi:hypothetical protein